MNSNWFKLVMKMTKVEYGKNLLLKGVPIIFNKGGAKLKIGENVTIKSSFLSNLVGLYSQTIIVTRAPGAESEIVIMWQKRETSCSVMKTVVTVIWCRAGKSRSVRTVSSGAIA